MTDNITLVAADIARRVPEMAKDSALNNALLVEGILREAGFGLPRVEDLPPLKPVEAQSRQ